MSDYPKAFTHPVTEQERTASSKAQEVALKFDGYREVETKAKSKSSDSDSSTTPKPTPPKGQENK